MFTCNRLVVLFSLCVYRVVLYAGFNTLYLSRRVALLIYRRAFSALYLKKKKVISKFTLPTRERGTRKSTFNEKKISNS